MAFIEYALTCFDDQNAFEQLCTALMFSEGYTNITPLGGPDDKGRDAEDIVHVGKSGERTTLFQFSLEKNIPQKIKKTLRRLKEAGKTAHELIFVFSTPFTKNQKRDDLVTMALEDYGFQTRINDQRWLAIRLGHPSCRDLATKFFAHHLAEFDTLVKSGDLFESDAVASATEQRCLLNFMNYARHPLAGDIRTHIIRQAIRTVLSIDYPRPMGADHVVQLVADYLPQSTVKHPQHIADELTALLQLGEVLQDNSAYTLSPQQYGVVQLDTADIIAGRRALLARLHGLCTKDGTSALSHETVVAAADRFFAELFRRHGTEVANAILDTQEGPPHLDTVLDPDHVAALLTETVAGWQPPDGNAFRRAIKDVLANPVGAGLSYLNALSHSYTCMQLLNIDPEAINVQRKRLRESFVLLDTDVLLTGIVKGADRERVSRAIADMCQKHSVSYCAFEHSIEEIVFRTQRSIQSYADLGRPTSISPEWRPYVVDIFLDIFLEELLSGRTGSFEEFIAEYYDAAQPAVHVRNLMDERLGVPVERASRYYIRPQDEKVRRLQQTIEDARTKALSFKNRKMYYADALEMIVVEQQNRELMEKGGLGRWYLVSGDTFILSAYLKHRDSFKVKPCILPVHFLELLRQYPTEEAREETFGAILSSESMLRGVGRNYTGIIAALTRIGVAALKMPTARVLEVIDEMDRADLTQWIVKLRSYDKVDPAILDEVRSGIERVLDESASRTEQSARLARLKGLAGEVRTEFAKLGRDKKG